MKLHNKPTSKELIKIFLMLIFLAHTILFISFILAYPEMRIDSPIFRSYYLDVNVFILNYLPIIYLLAIIYFISDSMAISYAINSFLFTVLAIVNKNKLIYRDDPFIIPEILYFRESMAMKEEYSINFNMSEISIIILLIIAVFFLYKYFSSSIKNIEIRLASLSFILILAGVSYNMQYTNSELYKNTGNNDYINRWNDADIYKSKGFVYPFIYSSNLLTRNVVSGYDEGNAKELLSKYEDYDISDDKKVNIIAIMLEAYSDFSKYPDIDIDESVYDFFHKIQKESISGSLITDVFAGNTIMTERAFLTGYRSHPRYLKNTNSHVWYLRNRGYNTEAMHPMYGWFYNRRNINEYLGFDKFYYYENTYMEYQKQNNYKVDYLLDKDFFPFIVDGLKDSIDKDEYYFNFSVTYQNHGPYASDSTCETEYFKKKDSYNLSDYNIFNNYLEGINTTGKALEDLVLELEGIDEPIVLVLFGDHKPWLGQDNSVYEMLNINLDLDTEDGFINYFEAPYIVWANSSAKYKLNRSFILEADDLSPSLLMSRLFSYMGWKGDSISQIQNDLIAKINVFNDEFYNINGKYVKTLPTDLEEQFNLYSILEFYISENFMGRHNNDY